MKRVFWGLLGCLVVTGSVAETVASMQKRTESSMLVTGSIDVAPDGAVKSYAIDHRDQLPPYVVRLVDRAALRWKFQMDPAEGSTDRHTNMTLRLVSKRQETGTYTTRISGATFGTIATDGEIKLKERMQLPQYPNFAVRYRINGIVYLIARVDREGKVTDASVEQINLDTVADEEIMRQVRAQFSKSCVKAALSWTFNVTAPGNEPDGAWMLRVPVNFHVTEFGEPEQDYGKWFVYVPGPREVVPWLQKYGYPTPSNANDAMPVGVLQPVGRQLALVTPLQED